MDIDQVSLIILQEHPRTNEVSPAFSVLLGCYRQQGLKLQVQDWTGQVTTPTIN